MSHSGSSGWGFLCHMSLESLSHLSVRWPLVFKLPGNCAFGIERVSRLPSVWNRLFWCNLKNFYQFSNSFKKFIFCHGTPVVHQMFSWLSRLWPPEMGKMLWCSRGPWAMESNNDPAYKWYYKGCKSHTKWAPLYGNGKVFGFVDQMILIVHIH